MRVALVTDYYLPTLGGVQTAVGALREGLERGGHEVTVCCPRDRDHEPEPGVVGLPVSPVFRPDGYPFAWSPRRVRRVLREELAARRVEVVHTHSEMFAALSGVRVARELGLPVVHTMHGRIDVYTDKVLPVPALSTALLAWLHHRQVPHSDVRVAATPWTQSRVARRMWRLMAAQARASDHVVVPSAHFAAKLARVGVRTPTTVVSNGVAAGVMEQVDGPTLRTLGPQDELRALWVGRLSPEKRPEVFVDAVRRTGHGVLGTVLGDGMSRRDVARAAAGAPVRLEGSVPQSQVLARMRESHVLVSSSVDFDNQPMVILEAVASGLPVLHADPDLAEVVPDGGGFAADTPDAAGLAAVLGRLRREPDLVRRASAAMLAARGSAAVPVAAMEQVYGGVVAAHGGQT